MTRIDDIIARRETVKILAEPGAPAPPPLPPDHLSRIVESAGHAPFHRAAHGAREGASEVCEPFRLYVFDRPACAALESDMTNWPEKTGKLPPMLRAAQALILVTWLAEPSDSDWEANEFNAEHIAAAAAATQNMLLVATSLGIRNYWSSGGPLRRSHHLASLGAGPTEQLLSAVFLFAEPHASTETQPGKLRARRTGPDGWARWIETG